MEKKFKLKKSVIVIGIIVILLTIALVLFFLIKGEKKPETNEDKYVVITFDCNGGSEVPNKKVKEGSTIKLPESEKEGYSLEGWYDGEEKVSSETTYSKDTKLVAKWEEEKTFVVKFDSKGGSKMENLTVVCNKKLELPEEPTRKGYNFIKWIDKNEKEVADGDLLPCEDITLTAEWEKEKVETFIVSFNSNGGTKVSGMVVECNAPLSLPKSPTKDGYTFVSWTDKNGKAILNGAKLTCEDINLYASWEEVSAATPTPSTVPTTSPEVTPTATPEVTPTPTPEVTATPAPTATPETPADPTNTD